VNMEQTRSFFAAKNARRKAGRAACVTRDERRDAEEARNRRRGLADETCNTLGAFGNLKPSEQRRFTPGTTGHKP
jgi:hypothetical protein